MAAVVAELEATQKGFAPPPAGVLDGDWELIYSNGQLFRSSPFFLAVSEAFADTAKSELFFKLHELQVRSARNGHTAAKKRRSCKTAPVAPGGNGWSLRSLGSLNAILSGTRAPVPRARLARGHGVHHPHLPPGRVLMRASATQVASFGLSRYGRVEQRIDSASGVLTSSFTTLLFGLTVVPLIGWGKLFPTFGGRVLSFARLLPTSDPRDVQMELDRTRVEEAPGVALMPLFGKFLVGNDAPVGAVWSWGGP